MWAGMPTFAFYEWTVLFIAIAGLLAVVTAPTRLTALVSLGIQGFAVALLFMLFGAPDLALTQFMVETLSVVILTLVMTRLNLKTYDPRPAGRRTMDVGLSLAVGAGFGLVLLSVVAVPFDARLSEFFAEFSRSIAHGRNIVNVIIVDFRGTDTMGELAVVLIAGLAILGLVRLQARATAASTTPPSERAAAATVSISPSPAAEKIPEPAQ